MTGSRRKRDAVSDGVVTRFPRAKRKPRQPRQLDEDYVRALTRFVEQLSIGEHPFSALHQAFYEWCEVAGINAPTATGFGRHLTNSGLIRRRSGAGRDTVYVKQ